MLRCRAANGERQTGVVKLAVPVLDAAAQSLRLCAGQQFQGFGAAKQLGFAQAGFAGQQVVHSKADTIKRRLPPAVGRNHKGQGLRDVGRVVQQSAALVQGFAHQRNIALRQVAHAAVHQLGGAR